MKRSITLSLVLCCVMIAANAQGGWKLTRDRDGIRVYQSDNKGFRNIKVECNLPGTLQRFTQVLGNVGNYHNWVYGNKTARILRQDSPDSYFYYSETAIPWPLQNRDAVVHARIERDGNALRLTETSVAGMVPVQEGKVRVTRSNISWNVTQTTPGTLSITYVFQAEPGGNVPAWIVNAFADKGPYESFRKLAGLLKP